MKKQRLTKQDIKQALLEKLNKRKTFAVWLTVYSLAAIICYIAYVSLRPVENNLIIICTAPLIILFFVAFLLGYYYVDLYKIKTERFEITEEALCRKAVEHISYYHRSEKENALYFRLGRVTVDSEAYSRAEIGDVFYVVTLGAKRAPMLAYNKKYFEII